MTRIGVLEKMFVGAVGILGIAWTVVHPETGILGPIIIFVVLTWLHGERRQW